MKTKILTLLSCVLALHAQAGSATWNLNPVDNNWQNAANWTPATVPNGTNDTATFAGSNQPGVFIGSNISVGQVVFAPGASAYTITIQPAITFTLFGSGAVNNSGQTQNFFLQTNGEGTFGNAASIILNNSASAGSGMVYTSEGGKVPNTGHGGLILFHGTSSAAQASFVMNGGLASGAYGGTLYFYDDSNGADATITGLGGAVLDAIGPIIGFGGVGGHSTAGNATVIGYGGAVAGSFGAVLAFGADTLPSQPTVIAYGGSNGAAGTFIIMEKIPGNLARMEIFGNSLLDASNSFGAEIGSLEGDGEVDLGDFNLTVGGNGRSTAFRGLIEDLSNEGRFGSLTKVGPGTLRLSNPSTFRRGTTIADGSVLVENATGTATGTGAVTVSAGTLGGKGIIAGRVTIGTGAGSGAALAPGAGAGTPRILTLQGSLTFKADSFYTCKVNTKKARADQVSAVGVTIASGAEFSIQAIANKPIVAGKVFNVINNTAATPIAGTFANLPNGGTLTVGANTFQASYSGGDGNDLTLTVIP